MTPFAIGRNIEAAFAEVKEQLEQLDVSELPYVEVTNQDVYKQLDPLSCVYFLIENGKYKQVVLYVGKTTNLRQRWKCGKRMASKQHACLDRCIDKLERRGSRIRLAWLQLERKYLVATEMLLINLWNPPWNVQKA